MKKKILFIIPTLTQTNGVAAFIQNYLNAMDLTDLDIHIICNDLRPSSDRLGFYANKKICVHFIPYIRNVNFITYLKAIIVFFKNNRNFDLIYSNVAYQSVLFFSIAKVFGMKNFAIHSHATAGSDNKLKNIVSYFLQGMSNHMTKQRFACSKLAGEAMFGDKAPFKVINNAIDYKKYEFNEENRKHIREQLNVDDNISLIGFVGRYTNQKNVFFFIELAKRLDNMKKILMIGTGDLKEKFVEEVNSNQLQEKIIFIDECNNVEQYYSAMDVFLLPSLFEGLPVTGIEAQVNGVPCVFSDTITRECKIGNNVDFVDRNAIDVWINKISNVCRTDKCALDDSYDIVVQSNVFKKELLMLCE